jgi:hypothetical protein
MPSICDQLSDLSDRLSRLEVKVEGKEEETEPTNIKQVGNSLYVAPDPAWGGFNIAIYSDMSDCVYVGSDEFTGLHDYLSSLLART